MSGTPIGTDAPDDSLESLGVFVSTNQKEIEMQNRLEEFLKALGWPVAIAGVITAVAALFGVPLENTFALFGVLVGLPFVISFIIDVLKQLKVVDDGTAAKWSAGLNLFAIIGLAIAMKFFPDFDYASLDAYIYQIGQAIAVIVMFILQLVSTARAHRAYVHGLGIKRFSYSASAA